MMVGLALRSMLARKLSLILTVVTLALSVALFLTIERLRVATRDSFVLRGRVSGSGEAVSRGRESQSERYRGSGVGVFVADEKRRRG